eukprot:10170448-Heterocapsa_arctica.AAC.1
MARKRSAPAVRRKPAAANDPAPTSGGAPSRSLVEDLRRQGMATPDIRNDLKERGYKKSRISQLLKADGER